ncbi:MAG: DUF883 domain-containing protein [Formivibrio sp.]|nr:DUF883 domain-containing protein [Formivibrio sp.]
MSDASNLLDQSQAILQETDKLLSEANLAVGKEADALYARVAAGLRDAKEKLMSAERTAVEKAKLAAEATDGYVHEHPWQAVGVAAAVGVLIGMLISRR